MACRSTIFGSEHDWGTRKGRRAEGAIGSSEVSGRWPRFAPVSCIFRLVTPVFRALTWDSPYSEETAPDVITIGRLPPPRPHSSRTLRFPFREPSSGPIHFPLDLIPSPRYYGTTQVIYKITAFFDNLTRSQLLAIMFTTYVNC